MTNLSETEVRELREIFNLVDKDGGGSISNEELKDLMDTVGIKLSQVEVDNMIKEIDQDSNGEVDFDEFVAVMSRKTNSNVTKREVSDAFKFFSKRNDGKISLQELKTVLMEKSSKEITKFKLDELLSKLTFIDGVFDYEAYLNRVMPETKH